MTFQQEVLNRLHQLGLSDNLHPKLQLLRIYQKRIHYHRREWRVLAFFISNSTEQSNLEVMKANH